MKKIYVCHSTAFDFQKELYEPLRQSDLTTEYDFVFPHDKVDIGNSKDIIINSDIVLAEVSYASTGMGIELGWANMIGKPIVAIYSESYKPSSSIHIVADSLISYTNKNFIENISVHLRLCGLK